MWVEDLNKDLKLSLLQIYLSKFSMILETLPYKFRIELLFVTEYV